MLVVFDPNIFVSALITPKGRARQVVQAGIDGQFEYAICPTLLDELERVSRRPKIATLLPGETVARFVVDVRGGARLEPDPEVRAISRDPADDYLVALALAINSDHLVTGDKDLLELAHPPVRITTLREFADLLEPPIVN